MGPFCKIDRRNSSIIPLGYPKPLGSSLGECGFSLVEIMVVVAVAGIITLAMTRQMVDLYTMTAKIEDKQSLLDLKNIVTMDLANSDICQSNFANTALADSVAVDKLVGSLGQTLAEKGGTHGRVHIDQITLKNETVPNTPNGTGRMTASILPKRANGQYAFKPLEVPIQVTLDADRRIQSCHAVGGGGGGCIVQGYTEEQLIYPLNRFEGKPVTDSTMLDQLRWTGRGMDRPDRLDQLWLDQGFLLVEGVDSLFRGAEFQKSVSIPIGQSLWVYDVLQSSQVGYGWPDANGKCTGGGGSVLYPRYSLIGRELTCEGLNKVKVNSTRVIGAGDTSSVVVGRVVSYTIQNCSQADGPNGH